MSERRKFAELFKQFNSHLEAAQIQGFKWGYKEFEVIDNDSGIQSSMPIDFDKTTYFVLVKRYKEMFESGNGETAEEIPYPIDGYITTIDTGKIDTDYMNSRFDKYFKLLQQDSSDKEELQKAEDELHKTFATLSQEEQKYANIFLHDIQSGEVKTEPGKCFRDYITEYLSRAKDSQVHRLVETLGLDEALLKNMMASHITESNINEFGRLDALESSVDKAKAKEYFEKVNGKQLPMPRVNSKVSKLLREFILSGGFDIYPGK